MFVLVSRSSHGFKVSEDEWKRYRDAAPAAVSDETLRELIHKYQHDPVALSQALERLWDSKLLAC